MGILEGPMLQSCRNVDDFEKLNRIEEGSYGIVYRAKDKITGQIVALKKLKLENEKDGFPITALREIHTLKLATHPNIVNVTEIATTASLHHVFIVMEYLDHDLKSLMEAKTSPFLLSEVKTLMMQLLSAVQCLHKNWIIHRDLKTSNLLMNNKGTIKVADFGLARRFGSPQGDITQLVVTLWYRAPELLMGATSYSVEIDMWSIGCIFGELLENKPLFAGKGEIDQLSKIFQLLGTPNDKIWPGYSQLPNAKTLNFAKCANTIHKRFSFLSPNGIDLLSSLLCYDPNVEGFQGEEVEEVEEVEEKLEDEEVIGSPEDDGSGSVFSPDEVEQEEDEDDSISVAPVEEDAEDIGDIIQVTTELEPTTTFKWDDYAETGLEGLPPAWPTYEVVNLDRRLPVKLKRHDYEPLTNPKLINISDSFKESSQLLKEQGSRKDDFSWTDAEKEVFFPYILHYGPNSVEMFNHLRDVISNSPQQPNYTLADLRKVSPDTPLLFLVSLHQLMTHLQLINSHPYTRKEDVLDIHGCNYYKNGSFNCYTCKSDCSVARYEASRVNIVVCIECFENGRFPLSLSSSLFQFHVQFVASTSPSSIKMEGWSSEEVLDLLDCVEKLGFDWPAIGKRLGKLENDCFHTFLSLQMDVEKTTDFTIDRLKELIGTPSNPTMSMINLLVNCVHPGLGSEAAKCCLSYLCKNSSNLITPEQNWTSALAGFDAAIEKARGLAQYEEEIVKGLHNDLIELQTEVLQKKIEVLAAINDRSI